MWELVLCIQAKAQRSLGLLINLCNEVNQVSDLSHGKPIRTKLGTQASPVTVVV